ncbi:Thyrostimulin alpha-2 subunit [Amphibalanus amphitrite]|uniref:Thyrostimulin alpha-2 subunit n=1 Tax=Amphibalanus amphitrite TaxID=1232801 RepID=A0A6A4VPZ1_AMPAM|nr:Thyrostimulin alpha-2 subunit [Amphibalanus amphitrite]
MPFPAQIVAAEMVMPTGAVLLLAVELTVLSCVLSAHLPHRTQSLELEKIGQLEAFEYDEPSCRLVGHTQRVVVPGCLPLALTVNACQGACESYALPSSWATMKLNPRHLLTSVSQCCNIMETKNDTGLVPRHLITDKEECSPQLASLHQQMAQLNLPGPDADIKELEEKFDSGLRLLDELAHAGTSDEKELKRIHDACRNFATPSLPEEMSQGNETCRI